MHKNMRKQGVYACVRLRCVKTGRNASCDVRPPPRLTMVRPMKEIRSRFHSQRRVVTFTYFLNDKMIRTLTTFLNWLSIRIKTTKWTNRTIANIVLEQILIEPKALTNEHARKKQSE